MLKDPSKYWKPEIISQKPQAVYDCQVEVKHVKPPKWRKEAKEEIDYSIKKIGEELDYEPQFSLKAGIKEILRSIFTRLFIQLEK